MDKPGREAEPQFSQPIRQIFTMLLVLGLVGAGAYIAFPRVAPVFLANPYLNGFIFFVFVIGVITCFWQVYQVASSVSWIEGFAANRVGHNLTRAPRLLAPLATLLRQRGARSQISASSSRSILDSVATRVDESRDITRYIVNLLIFLGLLGTFYGLATTVPAVVETIRSLERPIPAVLIVAQHIDSRFVQGLADWLGKSCDLPAEIAEDGVRPQTGRIYIAAAKQHLTLNRDGRFEYRAEPVDNNYVPSADALFRSLAELDVPAGVAILLSGMGDDGASGMKTLRDSGWTTIAQNRESSAVWGMPKAATTTGAAQFTLSPAEIGRKLNDILENWR